MLDKEEFKEKTILDRHQQDTKFNLATALLELESTIKGLKNRVEDLEGTILYMINEDQKNKIIVPDQDEINMFKKKS